MIPFYSFQKGSMTPLHVVYKSSSNRGKFAVDWNFSTLEKSQMQLFSNDFTTGLDEPRSFATMRAFLRLPLD